VTNGVIDAALRAALADIARVPQLLIGCDYDGTLAPLVDDPSAAGPLREAVAAVRALAAVPQTVLAVISGRALRDLATLSRLPSEVHLVGSHGSEFDLGFIQRLAPEQRALHARLEAELAAIVREQPGVRLESKPASIAVHVRGADHEVSERVLEAVRTGPATWPDIHVTHGKEVVELSLLATDKGAVILPKLYRRYTNWSARKKAKVTSQTFQKFLGEGSGGKPDTCYEIDDFLTNGVHSATPRNFADFVEGGKTIKFQPEGLVFGEAPSSLVGADGKPITTF